MSSRGDERAYDRYLAAMDASMRQKVAVLAAHVLGRGRVADMGMGSGTGSDALASLYPELEVVGVDLDPEMVARAQARFDRPNLSFVVGDIAQRVFEAESLDGIFDSSVLHHVTSFGGYDHDAAGRAIREQAAQLAVGGTLVVRDFVAPADDEPVWLDLRSDDGDSSDDPRTCSTAALFERFAREFRALHERPGFAFERLDDPAKGWRRYRLTHRLAVEMVLRKDYRRDWEKEVREEYCYFTQEEFEDAFARAGLRVLASTPIRNPWIVTNRFVGKIALHREDGTAIETTATNFVIAGEKVPDDGGVRFDATPRGPVGYLELESWRDVRNGRVMDLVRRPVSTIDVVPWFRDSRGGLAVMARMSYPRPMLAHAGDALDGSRPPQYVTEPIVVVDEGDPAVARAAAEALGLSVRDETLGAPLYPSPGGIGEVVRTALLEVEPTWVVTEHAGRSGFATDARVRAIDARQVLRAAQVGAMPDARTELCAYSLFARCGVELGPWIGAAFDIADAEGSVSAMEPLLEDVRACFEPCPDRAGFLELHAFDFTERDRAGNALARRALERVTPRPFSARTLSCAVLARVGGRVCIGIDDDDRPASMAIEGSSRLLVAPAFRLPHEQDDLPSATRWVRERLHAQYGLEATPLAELGGRYHPAPGLTPEVVHPHAWTTRVAVSSLRWVPLSDAARHADSVPDMHLRVAILRSAHALGETG